MTSSVLAGGLLLAASSAAPLSAARAADADLTERRLAWAHYVGWTVPADVSLPPARHYEFPVHERGADAFRDEVRRAIDTGLDGFFVDVILMREWRPGYFYTVDSLLKAAEGTGFMVAPCLDGKTDVSNQIDNVVWMLRRFGGHPNYPRVKGRYVVATYTYHEWTPQEWKAMLDGCAKAGFPIFLVGNVKPSCGVLTPDILDRYADVFDCCYSFAYTGRERLSVAEENRGVANWCREHGKVFMPCIHPGYIGAWLGGRNASYIPFEGNGTFLRAFDSAREAGQWLHFTSWNDNVETTLQPMASTPGNRALLRAAADAFKGLGPSAERIDAVIAYHREELPGTLLRFEAVRLPSRETGPATLSGALMDGSGRIVAALPKKRLDAGWARVEWLVPSADLSRHSELRPVFTLQTPSGFRRASFPDLLIRTPWIENQITVRATFADRADVDGGVSVVRRDGGLCATLSFKSPGQVARAILYRNDRPAGQFRARSQTPGHFGIPLLLTGECRFSLEAEGGSFVSALRRGQVRGHDGFDWSERRIVCRPATLAADSIAAWIDGPPDSELVYSSDGDGPRRFRLSELAERRRVRLRNGGLVLQTFPDCTLRDLPTLGLSEGTLSLNLLDRVPNADDSFYVRFELSDGRSAETARIRPFRPKTAFAEIPVLETAVTMETLAGAEDTPRIEPNVTYREFLTPEAEMPVRGTRALTREVSSGSLRRELWPLTADGRSILSDRWAYADNATFGVGPDGRGALRLSGRAQDAVRLPVRMWPMDTACVGIDIAPERAGPADIISRKGYGAAFTLRMREDGRLEATWSGGGSGAVWNVKCANAASVVSSGRVPLGRWTRVKLSFDQTEIRLFIDGVESARTSVAPFRAYGPTEVWLGGKGYFGCMSNLKIGPLSR